MSLHQSGEDYLEAILELKEQKGMVRSIDVAHHLNYSKPSVSRAVAILKSNGYIIVGADGHLELTVEGEQVARSIYERHRFLKEWLIRLGVSPETAEEDACKIEHNISEETFLCMKRHVEQDGN